MTHEEFNKLVEELEGESLKTLKEKNSKYEPCDDALRNFHVGASIMGVTTGECVWGYATKHISSLRDRIQRNDWNDLEDVKEKIQDTINYLRFLWCVANEENKKKNLFIDDINTESEDNCYNGDGCEYCQYDWIGDSDDHWDELGNKIIVEPCKSCKANFIRGTEEYKNAKNNYVRKK